MNVKLKRIIVKLVKARRGALSLFFIGILIAPQLLIVEPVEAGIYLRASSAGVVQNGGTTLGPINKPAGTVAGDVMIATIVVSGDTAISLEGWTSIVRTQQASAVATMETFRKTAGSSEPSSYTFNLGISSVAVGSITSYQGVDNSAPINISGGNSTSQVTTGGQIEVTASSVTTTVANTMLIANFSISTQTSFTPPTGMAERFDTQSNCGALCTNLTGMSANALQAASGATGNKIATTANVASGTYTLLGQQIALTPAPPPTLAQSAYRFSINADNITPAYIADNLTSANDTINGTTVDNSSSVFYAAGDNASNWVIQKRRIADGALCTSANCSTTFGTAGRITQDVASSTTEKAYGVAIDSGNDAIYVVGNDQVVANGQWRIEKRSASTGALITGFGTGGVIQSNLSVGDDTALVALVDKISGYLYVGGYDSGLSNGNNRWSLHKYRTDNGNICTAANCGTQFGVNGIYTYSFASNSNDRVASIEIDPTRSYLYVAGYSTATNGKTQWTMQKMRASDAALCTAANCGTEFGTGGIYTNDPTGRDDKIKTLQVDSAGSAIYLGGFEQNSATSSQWRIEKLNLATGTRLSAFGGSGCATNQAGALCANFSSGFDSLESLTLDGAGGYIYSLGVMDEQGTDSQWRIQKRNRSNGSLVSAWASSGTASANPSPNQDPPNGIVIDMERGLLWASGGDRTLSATNMQWYFTQLQLDTGTLWLDNQNTATGASTNITFRLRMLIHTTTQNLLVADAYMFKLQYAPKSGTCDTGFVGESYVDLATSGSDEILYHDNPTTADAASAVAVTGDPAHGTDVNVLETVEELNNFTNINDVLNGQDGLWDFVLKDNGAFGAYCFKVVNSDGTDLAAYNVIPEITFCKDDPKTEALLRHGASFCEGIKKSFIWAL